MHRELVTRERGEPLHLSRSVLPEAAALEVHRDVPGLAVEPPSQWNGGQWVLRAGDVAGIVPLHEGLSLRIEPKIPVPRLLQVLHEVLGVQPRIWADRTARLDVQDLYEIWVQTFLAHSDRRLRQGLHQAYRPLTERRWTARGRPDMQANLRRPARLDLVWQYEDLTRDLLENQVLAWTLHVLSRTRIRSPRLQMHLRRTYRAFMQRVLPRPVTATQVDDVEYTRLTQDYKPMHRLAQMFLRHQGPRFEAGSGHALPFLIDMPELYERWVGLQLQKVLPDGWTLRSGYRLPLQSAGFTMIPDFTAFDERGNPRAVLDAKYKADAKVAPADAYQLVSYATCLGIRAAWIVHPEPYKAPMDQRVGEVRVRDLVVPLG